MATTELEDVQALLDRVRPDPTGFAQRLLVQVMTRFGNVPEPDPTTFYTQTPADDVSTDRIVITPSEPPSQDEPVDTNLLLAAALGACHCWGLRADCEVCGGEGSTGWIMPDPELFKELIEPVVMKMSRGHRTAEEMSEDRRTEQGVDR